ncbi:MAG: hypothetical protein ABIP38_06215 [Steroidobacteraceae bacterium]
MTPASSSFASLIRQPSAYLPLAMSLGAIATLLIYLALYGPARQADEGGAAHFWQLLMVAQAPIVAYFAIKWLPRSPATALVIVVLQIGAAVAAAAPVILMGW